MKKKVLAVVIVLALLFTALPGGAFADESAAVSGSATFSPQESASAPGPEGTASAEPTETASAEPTDGASAEPTDGASAEPTDGASAEPTVTASTEPAGEASAEPTDETSVEPTETASAEPTDGAKPSEAPVLRATSMMLAAAAKYSVSVSAGDNGTLANPSALNGSYTSGTALNLNDTAPAGNIGYSFDKWQRYTKHTFIVTWYSWDDCSSSVSVSSNADENQFRALFKVNSYPLTITAGPNGRITTRGLLKDAYDYGTKVYLWYSGAAADDNYDFDYWLDEETGAHLGGELADTQITIDTDNRYKAIFKGEPKHLHTYAGDNGTLGNDLDGFYPYGSTVDLNSANPQPSTGYRFDHWEEQVNSIFGPWKPMGSSIATVGWLNEYRAVFAKEQFTVTWKFGNGAPDKTITRDYAANITSEVPANPSKDGYEFTGWSYDGGTAADITSLKHNITITATYRQLTVSGITVEGYDKPYDGQPHGVKINGDCTGLTVEYSTDGGVTFTGTAPAYTNVVNQQVVVRVSRPNYANYEQTVTVNISKKPLTVTAEAKETAFGEAAPPFTATYSGFATGESETTLGTASLAFDCGYSVGSGVGTYDITPKGLDSSWTNYDISYRTGTLTVNPASSDSLAVSGLDITYDGKPHQVSVLNLRPGDTVEYSGDNGATYSSDNPVFQNVTPAEGATVTVRVTNPNYASYTGSAVVKINAATLTVQANNKTATYGGTAPVFDYSITGYVNGEETAATPVVSGSAACGVSGYAAKTAVGNYTVGFTSTGLLASNYIFDYKTGTLTVNPATLTVTANNKSVTYGSVAPTFNYKIEGFVNGETKKLVTGTAACGYAYMPTTPIGSYPISFTTQSLAAPNYTFTYVDGTLKVNKATLTVTANDKAATYGDAVGPAFDYAITGYMNGEDTAATPVVSGTAACGFGYSPSTEAGNHAIVFSQKKLKADNYKFAYVDGTLTVNKATLTVTAGDKTATYGGTAPVFDYTIEGYLNGDDTAAASVVSGGAVCGVSGYSAKTAVGSHTIGFISTGLLATNYTFDYKTGTLTVNPATLTVAAGSKTATYGGTAPAFDYGITGYVNGEDATTAGITGNPTYACAYNTADPANRAVGSYNIVPDVSAMGSANYIFTPANGSLAVNSAPLTITANSEVLTYNDDVPAYSASYTGFVNGDGPSSLGGAPVFACGYAKGSPVGSYPIAISGYTSSNYAVTFVSGNLTVNETPARGFRVVFLNYDGTLLKVEWVGANNPATAPTAPTRPGYTFTGWSTAFDKVTNDMSITALFAPVAAAAAAPSAQSTVIPEPSVPAAAPSVSPSAPASPSQESIGENQVPQAAPSAGAQEQQSQNGFPLWLWIIIAAAVAGFLIWLFGFKLRKREQS